MPIILPRENMTEKERLEALVKNTEAVTATTVAKYFTIWLENFRANLPAMWQDGDVKDMPKANGNKSAIVIGGGPSLMKFNHLEVLAKSGYEGTVFVADRVFKPALAKGVKVDYVVNLDSSPLTVPFIDRVHAPNTGLILTSMAHPDLRKAWQGKTYWFCDDLATCVCKPSFAEGLAIIANKTWTSSGAHAGGACINMAWFTGHNPIGLIGMDLAYDIDEPLESTPYWANYVNDLGPDAKKAFIRGRNRHWGNEYYTDYVFQIYKHETLSRIQHFNMPVMNLSGQGALDEIPCMNFSQFLKKHGH